MAFKNFSFFEKTQNGELALWKGCFAGRLLFGGTPGLAIFFVGFK